MIGYVYLIVNKQNGKKYVGCTTTSLRVRWKQHLRAAEKGRGWVLHQALRKYGKKNFGIVRLAVVHRSHADLLAMEVEWIAKLDCVVPNGYNMTPGGRGVDFSVPEMRRRHLEGIRRRSKDPQWREVLQRRSADAGWQKGNAAALHKAHTDPKSRQAQREGLRKLFSDPEYQAIQAARNRKTTSTEKWRQAHASGVEARSEDPEWQKAQAPKLEKARAVRTAKALERDALCTPEERASRVDGRERMRRCRSRKRQRAVES